MSLADQQLNAFEKNLRSVISRMAASIIASAKSGKMFTMGASDQMRYSLDLYDSALAALKNSGYDDIVRDLIDKNAELISEIRAARGKNNLPTAFSKTSEDVFNAFKEFQFNQFQFLGRQFVDGLSSELMNYMVSGGDELGFIQKVYNMLSDKFQRYAYTYANTSRAQAMQKIEDIAAENYDGDLYWEYVGPVDDRLRPACEIGTSQRYFTNDERIQFENQYADERAWNCRHTFTQITEDDYRANTGENAKQEAKQEKKEREATMNLDPETKSAFDDLGITPKSSIEDVKKTFRGLAKLFHPDKGGTEAQMRIIIEAKDKAIQYLKDIKKGGTK